VTGAVERRDLDGSDFLLKEDKQGKRSDDLLQVEVAAHQRMNSLLVRKRMD